MCKLKKFLASIRGELLIYFAVNFIYFLVFYAFNVNVHIIWYCVFISFLILITKEAYGFYKYVKRIENIKDFINANININYPNEVESLFIDNILDLRKELRDERKKFDTYILEVEEFYTTWIHQIKTPISANSLLLKEKELNREALKLQNLKINEYVNMLLGYIRNSGDSTDYLFTEISLDDVIRESVKSFSDNFIIKNISLKYEPININVISDKKWLIFIISQVLSNALKYTKEYGEISIYFKDNALCIKDNGIGVSKEDITRVFDKGYTGFNGRMYLKSTGLGLYLVKSIGDKLNIKTQLISKNGVEFKFIFRNDSIVR